MAVDTNINQFKQGRAVGDLDLNFFGGASTISCRYSPEGTGDLIAGEAVKLLDLGADDVVGPPIIDKRAGDTTAIYGVVIRSLKQSAFAPGAMVEIAIEGSVMFLRAGAELARGVKVSAVKATSGNIQAIGTKAYLGYTLDKAANTSDIVRVFLKADAVTAGTT